MNYIYMFGREYPVYGFFIALGMVSSMLVIFLMCRKHKLLFEDAMIANSYAIMFAVVGAKLLYLFTIIDKIQYKRILEKEYLESILEGGFVFYGGLIFAVLGFALACKIHKLNFQQQFPVLITIIPLGHALGRLGCHFVGCCHGMEYAGRLSITYTQSFYAPNHINLFPSQLIEAILNIILFIILFVVNSKKLDYNKSLLIYGCSYGIYRFFLEFFRGDSLRGNQYGLTTSQWISIFIIISCIYYKKRQKAIDIN